MKRLLRIFVIIVAVIFAVKIPSMALDEDMDGFLCGTAIEEQKDNFALLIQEKIYSLLQEQGITPYTAIGRPGLMPSTGNVRVLVLPIMFSDSTPILESWEQDYKAYQELLFGKDTGELEKDDWSLSTRLSHMSYGRLNITGDVLPFYYAPNPKTYYDKKNKDYYTLAEEALMTYNIDYAQYDADKDGYVDCLILIGGNWANDNVISPSESSIFKSLGSTTDNSGIKNDGTSQIRQVVCVWGRSKNSYTVTHEIGHCIGLMDNYNVGLNLIPGIHDDIMAGKNTYYMNAFYKYLLGWIDPVIITDESPIEEIKLCAVEEETAGQEPKAVIYIPNKENLPFSELFIAEYRTGKEHNEYWNIQTKGAQPGITLWHCDGTLNRWGGFERYDSYLKAVCPTGVDDMQFSNADRFVPAGEPWSAYSTSTVISPDTTPVNSDFYDGVKTNFYMEVVDMNDEYATLKIGSTVAPAHTHEYSAGWKSDGTSHWHECECGDKKDTAAHTPVEDKAVEPTCTAPGKTAGSHCSECGYVITAQIEVPTKEHTYSEKWRSDSRNHWHECDWCHQAKKDIAPHVEGSGVVMVAPTLTTRGLKGFYCVTCNLRMRTEFIPELNPEHTHEYSAGWKSDGTSHWHECECGDKKDTAAHTWDRGTVTTTPTASTAGVRTYTCTACGRTRTESIPATGGGSTPSGGGGSSTPARYSVAVEKDLTGGSVTSSVQRAEQGDKVTLTVRAQEGYTLEEVEVKDGKGKEVTLTKESGGKYTFTMPGSKVTVTARFAEKPKEEKPPEVKPGELEKPTLPFSDVKEGAWYYGAVAEVYGKGLMMGLKETEFSPETPASRGMVAYALYRMEGEPAAGNSSYSDVANGKYYAPAVAWAMANGIVKGYGDGTFRPDRAVTREELAAILYRYEEYKGKDMAARADLSGFTDAGQISGYAREPLAWAKAQGFISGTDWGGIHPGGYASRAETAAILFRLFKQSR